MRADVEDRPGTVILRALRYVGWIDRGDLYEIALGLSPDDPTRRNTWQQALRRLKLGGFIEYDADRLMYRITFAGRAELAVRQNRLAYYERESERARRAGSCSRRARAA